MTFALDKNIEPHCHQTFKMRLPLLEQQVLDHYSFCGWPLLAWCHSAPDCDDEDAVDDDAGGGVLLKIVLMDLLMVLLMIVMSL